MWRDSAGKSSPKKGSSAGSLKEPPLWAWLDGVSKGPQGSPNGFERLLYTLLWYNNLTIEAGITGGHERQRALGRPG